MNYGIHSPVKSWTNQIPSFPGTCNRGWEAVNHFLSSVWRDEKVGLQREKVKPICSRNKDMRWRLWEPWIPQGFALPACLISFLFACIGSIWFLLLNVTQRTLTNSEGKPNIKRGKVGERLLNQPAAKQKWSRKTEGPRDPKQTSNPPALLPTCHSSRRDSLAVFNHSWQHWIAQVSSME